MSNFPGLSVKANLKIIEQLQLLYAQIQSVRCKVCVWQPPQTWVFWSVSPFHSSVPSHLGSPREDGLVFLSSLPSDESFQPDCVNLALLYYGTGAESACKCHLPSSWWCQGTSKKDSAVAWNPSKSRWEAGPRCRQGCAWAPAEEPDFSPWIPSWHLSEGFCLYKVGQVWALDSPLCLVHSKPRNKASLKALRCQTFFLLFFFFFWV